MGIPFDFEAQPQFAPSWPQSNSGQAEDDEQKRNDANDRHAHLTG
jgi:hypothetical protein